MDNTAHNMLSAIFPFDFNDQNQNQQDQSQSVQGNVSVAQLAPSVSTVTSTSTQQAMEQPSSQQAANIGQPNHIPVRGSEGQTAPLTGLCRRCNNFVLLARYFFVTL